MDHLETNQFGQSFQEDLSEVAPSKACQDTCPNETPTIVVESVQSLLIRILTSDQQEQALSIWQLVEQNIAEPPIASSVIWTKTWLKYYGNIISHRFVVATANDHPVAIALLVQGVSPNRGLLTVRSLQLGTTGEHEIESICVEYNDLLVLPLYRKSFVVALNDLFKNESCWDQFCIDGWESNDFQKYFQSEPKCWQKREVRSFYHNLAQARENNKSAYDQLSYSTRKKTRKNLKIYGKLKCEWAETIEQADDIFNNLMQLHQARWVSAGEPGVYASQRFVNFQRDIILQLLPEKKVGLFRLSDDKEILGCVHVFIDRNRALSYQAGLAPFTQKKSPGLLVDLYCMEECLQRGLDAYDFLGGEMHHKERLSTNFNTLVWATYRRKRLKFQITNLLRKCKDFVFSK